jgi:ubiquinone/menaquinone biosynthesis C-methylase UbiE
MEQMIFYERRIAEGPAEAQAIVKLTKKTGGKALDLCCGIGHHAIAFSKIGFDVTGVDLTAYYLEKAKKAAEKENANVEWVREDSRFFVRQDAFDLVLNLGESFGLSEKQSDDIGMLANIYKSLKKDGALVMQLMGKELMGKAFVPSNFDILPDGTMVGQRSAITDSWGRVRGYRILINKAQGKVTEMNISHWLYSGHELRMMLGQAGFPTIRIFGGLDGSEYGINSRWLVITAQK